MQKRGTLWRVLAVLVMAMIVTWLGACASKPDSGDPIMEGPPGPNDPVDTVTVDTIDGAVILEQSCTQCHGLDRVTSAQKTQDEWAQTVDRMIKKGAEVSDKEVLVVHLSETYGP